MARSMRSKKSRKLGFTLVELLVVVSIIGVLATIGIPTFRTMVQKSKKSEAKVALGGLYTSETAFFSEYNTYGNNLPKVGFDLDAAGGLIYSVGFPNSNTCGNPGFYPAAPGTNEGNALNVVFPGYYTGGNTSNDIVYKGKVSTRCATATMPNTGISFTATATGLIAPSKTGAADADYDVWSMTNARVLANTQDGVFK